MEDNQNRGNLRVALTLTCTWALAILIAAIVIVTLKLLLGQEDLQEELPVQKIGIRPAQPNATYCWDNVTYYYSRAGIAVAYNKDGTLKLCDMEDRSYE